MKYKQLSPEEIKFVATTTAKNINEFAEAYIAKFGAPKTYLRIQTMWYQRKAYEKKYQKMTKVKPKTKTIVLPAEPKKKGEPMPVEGEILGKIHNQLLVIEQILKDGNHIAEKTYTVFEGLSNKKREAERHG